MVTLFDGSLISRILSIRIENAAKDKHINGVAQKFFKLSYDSMLRDIYHNIKMLAQ
jgi:hypothetical protein